MWCPDLYLSLSLEITKDVCTRVGVHPCVCVCVCEREREREIGREKVQGQMECFTVKV